MKPKIGMRVSAKSPHGESKPRKVGVIKKISTPAIGVMIDGKLHKWYVASELEKRK